MARVRHDATMRAVVQRVSRAEVRVDQETVARIGHGLLVLLAVTHSDDLASAARIGDKLFGLRILPGETSLADTPDAAALVVSQFTLYGDARAGRRPTWAAAAPGPVAEPLIEQTVRRMRELGATVHTGRFGAQMEVELVNDGPFTVLVEI
jgi:D-tyrosyl-tRNA(Tyr) deacylase